MATYHVGRAVFILSGKDTPSSTAAVIWTTWLNVHIHSIHRDPDGFQRDQTSELIEGMTGDHPCLLHVFEDGTDLCHILRGYVMIF